MGTLENVMLFLNHMHIVHCWLQTFLSFSCLGKFREWLLGVAGKSHLTHKVQWQLVPGPSHHVTRVKLLERCTWGYTIGGADSMAPIWCRSTNQGLLLGSMDRSLTAETCLGVRGIQLCKYRNIHSTLVQLMTFVTGAKCTDRTVRGPHVLMLLHSETLTWTMMAWQLKVMRDRKCRRGFAHIWLTVPKLPLPSISRQLLFNAHYLKAYAKLRFSHKNTFYMVFKE